MKTRKSVKIFVALLVLSGALLGFELFRKALSVSSMDVKARKIAGWIHYYILQYHRFPPSEEDLEQKGLLKKTQTSDGVEYSYRYPSNVQIRRWKPAYGFKLFKISYGLTAENLQLIDGKVYDKTTQKEVLLIEGPYKQKLKETYELISRNWYQVMLEKSRAREATAEPEDNE
ncbi:MAG: hypothetical protein ACYTEQ_15125 [Planctomycetota bacterium]